MQLSGRVDCSRPWGLRLSALGGEKKRKKRKPREENFKKDRLC